MIENKVVLKVLQLCLVDETGQFSLLNEQQGTIVQNEIEEILPQTSPIDWNEYSEPAALSHALMPHYNMSSDFIKLQKRVKSLANTSTHSTERFTHKRFLKDITRDFRLHPTTDIVTLESKYVS